MPQNPRYNLRDASGNLLGTLYATTNDEIAIHHAASAEEMILGSGGINVSGVTADSVDATSASVSNAPSVAADVARLSEIDDLDAAKADQDGGGVETIENYDLMDTEFATHSNTIDSDHTIPAGKGSVVAGELSGTGSVSGDGALAVIDEGIHNAVKNPIEETVDAAGNDITNVGSIGSNIAHVASQLDIPVYSDDTNAPAETHYFNDTDGVLKYKDASGTVHGPAGTSDTISVQNNTGEVFAREFAGADLSAKVQNALDSLAGGYGRVRITPKADGTAWSWDQDLTIDTTNYNGLELDFDQTVEVDYTGSGWAITLDGVGGATDTQARITGGVWTNSGDPAGWLRIQDCFGTVVRPTEVEVRNSTADATAVSIQNVNSWSESTRVSGTYRADIGIDTVPASVTGGSGTESFHDTYLDNPKINAYNIGIRMRGYFDYCLVSKPIVWPKADGVSAYVLGASRMDGTTIVSLKAESSGGTNHIGIETVSGFEGFYYGPTIIGGRFDIDGQQFANNGGVAGAAPFIRTWQREFKVDDMTGGNNANILAEGDGKFDNIQLQASFSSVAGPSLSLESEGSTFLDSSGGAINYAYLDPQDVRGKTASKGYVAYHDPSINGDGNTEGPAFYNGTDWISQVDGTTIA